ARSGGDALQGGGSAPCIALQQRLGNDGIRLGRASKSTGENSRRNTSRENLNSYRTLRVEIKVPKSTNPKPNKNMMPRRQAIKTTALASAALATLPGAIAQTNSTPPAAPY